MQTDRRLIDLTEQDLRRILDEYRESVLSEVAAMLEDRQPDTVKGLDGIAQLYHCSRSTAARIKRSGVLGDAVWQHGRTIITDRRKALELKPN